jgi:hypothetical protein
MYKKERKKPREAIGRMPDRKNERDSYREQHICKERKRTNTYG